METEDLDTDDLRSEIRQAASEFAAVEFKPSASTLNYLFKLREISSSGLGLIVKKNSDFLNHVRVEDILTVKFHKGSAAIPPQYFKAQIRHISEPVDGTPENHMIVGLLFLEKLDEEAWGSHR